MEPDQEDKAPEQAGEAASVRPEQVLLPIVVITIGDSHTGDTALKGILMLLALASVVADFRAAEEGGVTLAVAEDEDGAGN
jgi:hypothetical protein